MRPGISKLPLTQLILPYKFSCNKVSLEIPLLSLNAAQFSVISQQDLGILDGALSHCSGFALRCWIWNLYWTIPEAEWGWEYSGQSQSPESRHRASQAGETGLPSHCGSTFRYLSLFTLLSLIPDELNLIFSLLSWIVLVICKILRCLYGSLATVWKEGEKENSSSK